MGLESGDMVGMPMAQLGQEGGGYIPSEDDMKQAARRSIALGVLPSLIRDFKQWGSEGRNKSAEILVGRAYALADEMISQGHLLEENDGGD